MEGRGKAKILRLCNEIEDIACDIGNQTMNDVVYAEARMIFDKLKEIAAEITAPPKSNSDRIRHMTDEELVDVLRCNCCAFNNEPECATVDCKIGHMKWLEKKVNVDVLDQ